MLNVQLPFSIGRLSASAALLTAGVSASLLWLATPALATPLGNGQHTFDRAPRLVNVSASSTQVNLPNPLYQLTITVPQDAGSPLEAITITQPKNQAFVQFQPSATRVFAGDPVAEIPLVNIGGAQPEAQELTVQFHHPVQPGQTVTIHLTPERNPAAGGVYLFGVTAYPAGDNSPGLFLGYRPITIQSPSGR